MGWRRLRSPKRGAGTQTRPARPYRRLRRYLAVLLVLLLAWLIGGYLVIVTPSTDKPRSVDAVLVLGPPEEAGALARGRQLVEAGYARNLLVSVTAINTPAVDQFCRTGLAGVNVTCFIPSPTTTQGEARYLAATATRRGWKSVIVCTVTYHVSRCRLRIERCFHGTTLMIAADQHITADVWRYQFLYESGAWVKALIQSSC